MRIFRSLAACTAALIFALALSFDGARAESNKVRVGKAVGGSGFHIPSLPWTRASTRPRASTPSSWSCR